MILTLVPDVGADKQDGATESTGPPVVVDVAVSGRQETGALGAGELALSGTQPHAAVHPVCLPYVSGACRPNIRGYDGERGGGPLRVPRMAAGGLSSVFRRDRRWFRHGLSLIHI